MISQDTVRREMLRARDGAGTPAIPLLAALMEYGYRGSAVTIIEGILNSAWYEPLFRRAVELFRQENINAYYYDLPFGETLKRHAAKGGASGFGAEDMRRWWNEKDYIGFIAEKTLTAEIPLEDAVKMIVSDVLG